VKRGGFVVVWGGGAGVCIRKGEKGEGERMKEGRVVTGGGVERRGGGGERGENVTRKRKQAHGGEGGDGVKWGRVESGGAEGSTEIEVGGEEELGQRRGGKWE